MRIVPIRIVLLLVAAGVLVACGHSDAPGAEVRGSDLRTIIENQIRTDVRESYGEYAGQNFSDADLDRFVRDKVPDQIVAQLKMDSRFLAAVAKVRAMPPADRDAYLQRCRLPLRKTWGELGEISPKGTTEAGQKAELAISNAIVDLAEKLLTGSPGPPK